MYLPLRVSGNGRDLDVVLGHRNRALLGAHQLVQAPAVVAGQLAPADGQDEGERRQTLLAMRRADDDDVAHRASRA